MLRQQPAGTALEHREKDKVGVELPPVFSLGFVCNTSKFWHAQLWLADFFIVCTVYKYVTHMCTNIDIYT